MTAPPDINGTVPAFTDAEAELAYFMLGGDPTPPDPASYPAYDPTVDVAVLSVELDRIGNLDQPAS